MSTATEQQNVRLVNEQIIQFGQIFFRFRAHHAAYVHAIVSMSYSIGVLIVFEFNIIYVSLYVFICFQGTVNDC